MKDKSAKILSILAPLISIGLILVLWAVEADRLDNKFILPTISDTLNSFFELFTFTDFYNALLATLIRTVVAFVTSFSIAFLLVLLGKKFPLTLKFINPIIAIVRVLPTVAVVLLLVFWTSSASNAAIVVTSLVVLPTLFTGIANALNSVDQKQLEMCKVFGVSYKKVLFKVQIPQILPQMLKVIGGGISLNLKLMVAAEVLAQTAVSIGYLMDTSQLYHASRLMALVLVTIIIGVIIELTFNLLSKFSGRWQK